MSQWLKILNAGKNICSSFSSSCFKITNVGRNICTANPTNCIKINDVRPQTWDIGIQTTAPNQTFTIIINDAGDEGNTQPNITIDWGDGSTPSQYYSIGSQTKTYISAGNYTIKILGSLGADGHIRLGITPEESSRVKSTSVIPKIPGLNFLDNSFYNCNELTSIPEKIFANNIIYSFESTFNGCRSLTSIPSELFANNINAYSFSNCFSRCSLLNFIPANLFANNTTAAYFDGCFSYCDMITSVPATLFQNNLGAFSFANCFLDVTLTTQSYSDLIINMASNATLRYNGVLFGGGKSRFNSSAQSARNALTAKGWVFSDLGLQT